LLFSGATLLRIRTPGGKYTRDYVNTLITLAHKDIELVYPGHDDPFNHDVRAIILETLQNVRNSEII
jgi:glyoxylase-like metal-dependent hydrolase (beta-lactamase superfamily II)